MNEWFAKACKADGILLASPTQTGTVSTEVKAFIDRIGILASVTGAFANKVGAPIVTARRGGAIAAYDTV